MECIENIHRYFIQFMLKNGISTIPRATRYCSKVGNETISEEKLGIIVNQINRVISNQYFKIIFAKCEVTQVEMVIWLSLKNDTLTKLHLNFTERQLEYFQSILHEIINSEQRKLMFVVCINITSSLTGNLSRDNALKVLEKWIEAGYFVKNDEFVHLGPRLIFEFTSYLRSCRPECVCCLCSEISFTGKICDSCDKIFHSFCIERYMRSHSSCPNCKEEWSETQVFKNIAQDNTTNFIDSDIEDMDYSEVVNEPGPSHRR
ncbi:hypothetical protein WA026_007770 [Henosepilachna vigintioctopunctata]|uniref:Non-structural maintenance of chromosomes element 1 homolog n=1 Tax=Henosepilachna vigintioctopunctata TaxID=420089 RepID=A0AAW1TXB5_9CUCU